MWQSFLPYLARECMLNDSLGEERRAQVGVLLSRHLNAAQTALARRLARETLLAALDEAASPKNPPRPEDDAGLASLARGARALLPGIDWWKVQNRVWDLGVGKFPLLAKELGFR
jgi:hypothetical protein